MNWRSDDACTFIREGKCSFTGTTSSFHASYRKNCRSWDYEITWHVRGPRLIHRVKGWDSKESVARERIESEYARYLKEKENG